MKEADTDGIEASVVRTKLSLDQSKDLGNIQCDQFVSIRIQTRGDADDRGWFKTGRTHIEIKEVWPTLIADHREIFKPLICNQEHSPRGTDQERIGRPGRRDPQVDRGKLTTDRCSRRNMHREPGRVHPWIELNRHAFDDAGIATVYCSAGREPTDRTPVVESTNYRANQKFQPSQAVYLPVDKSTSNSSRTQNFHSARWPGIRSGWAGQTVCKSAASVDSDHPPPRLILGVQPRCRFGIHARHDIRVSDRATVRFGRSKPNTWRVQKSQVHPGVEPTILEWFVFLFLSGVWSMPILKVLLAIAVVPAVATGYVTVMGTTGACSTCASIVSMVTGSASSDSEKTDDATTAATTDANETSNSTIVAEGMFTVPLIDLQGNQTTLAAYAGRPMLVEVWATWCGPCRKVRSILKENEAALSKIATVVGVSVDQGGAAVVTRYLEKSPSPGILEFMVTPQFRAAIAPFDTQNTIPKLLYVRPDGQVSNLSYGANSPKFMMALLQNLAKKTPSSNSNPAG